MFERMKYMLFKEFIQIFRDPRMKFVIFVSPVVQVLVFGYAATNDVRQVPIAVYDLDNSVTSRELVVRFVRSGYFNIVTFVQDERHAIELIDRDKVRAVLRMNKGFESDVGAGRTAQLQVIVDGTDSNMAGIVLNYSTRIAEEFSREILTTRLMRLQGLVRIPGQIEVQTRAWFNENLESRNFYVPAIIANLVLLTTMLLTSMAVVREKEIGTLEQILVTPITPVEFILGKTIPFILIGFANVSLITGVGVFWFKVPIRGSLILLFLATVLYLMTTLGVGLLISTISQTQQQAMMSSFFFTFPAMLLSGFTFPITSMPQVIQWLTYLNPLRYFLVIIRGIFLKGVGVSILWPQMVALALIGLTVLGLASRRFQKTLT